MAWYQRYRDPLAALREDVEAQANQVEQAEAQRNAAQQVIDMLVGAQQGGEAPREQSAALPPGYQMVPLQLPQRQDGRRVFRQLTDADLELTPPAAPPAQPKPLPKPIGELLFREPVGPPVSSAPSTPLSEAIGKPVFGEMVGPPAPVLALQPGPKESVQQPSIPDALKRYSQYGLTYRQPDLPHVTTVWDGLKRKIYEAPARGEWATAPSRDGRILVFDEDGAYLRTERVGDEENKKYQRGQVDIGGQRVTTPSYRESLVEQVFRETPEYQRMKAMQGGEAALSELKHRQMMEYLVAKQKEEDQRAESARQAREKERETQLILGTLARNQSVPPELVRYAEQRGILPKEMSEELLTPFYFPPISEGGKVRPRKIGELIDYWADTQSQLPYQSLRTKLIAQGVNDAQLTEMLAELANQYNISRIDTPIGNFTVFPPGYQSVWHKIVGDSRRPAKFEQGQVVAEDVPERERRKLAILLQLLNVPASAPQPAKK